MSRRKRNRAPLAAKLVVGILAVALLAALAVLLGRGVLSAAQLIGTDGGPTTSDPMFRGEVETVTRPPEAESTAGAGREDTDPSAHWEVEEEGPVDQTLEELAREAAEAAAPEN